MCGMEMREALEAVVERLRVERIRVTRDVREAERWLQHVEDERDRVVDELSELTAVLVANGGGVPEG